MGLEEILEHRDWEGGIVGRKARFVLGDVNGHSYWVEGARRNIPGTLWSVRSKLG